MSEVKRYWIPYGTLNTCGWHQDDNEVVLAGEHDAALDAQRLRADTAEAELKIVRKSRADELENYNALISDLAAAEQRIADLEAALTEITPRAKGVGSKALKSRIYSMLNIKSCEKCLGAGFIGFDNTELRSLNGGAWGRCLACRPYTIDAALNQKSECCTVTPEEQALLDSGDYGPEELFGIGGKPSCPKCINQKSEGESQ